ncbi:SAM-dependent methyltransferase [uncultured Desulfosarcina sp.]|uniref:SAM-dependent methyltransferase n=1 Tax=uncultured Desulfosarcina sp. TaxID=218289 RepID=UPI0029C6C24D|nr:SAM-dependent methyltransferase [uncultured Desulfosarcina sp.]
MKGDQSSITAENNALLRAHEAMRPESERICHDPYAVYFMPDRILSSADRTDQIEIAISDWETHFPGVCNSILARTRFIDDCLEEAINDGLQQLVILGAGYDTRAFRFRAIKEKTTVFELDHPTTQKRKLAIIQNHLDWNASSIRHIPIDFAKEELSEKLFSCGYDDRLKTLFIWEGITYYISASAVDRTLDFINHHTPSKSGIVFDYFPPTVADGTTRLPEAKALREGLKRIGEELLFGIKPDEIFAFMKKRGFQVVRNLSSRDYQQAYCKRRNVSDMFLFVQATVSR